jgi:hypothetical protein
MDIRTKAPQLHLLTLSRLNSQWVRIYPLIRRYIRGFGRICQDIKYGRLVNYREEGNGRNNLFEDISDFGLYFGFGLGWGPVSRLCGSVLWVYADNIKIRARLGGLGSLLNQVYVEYPTFEWCSRVFGDDS